MEILQRKLLLNLIGRGQVKEMNELKTWEITFRVKSFRNPREWVLDALRNKIRKDTSFLPDGLFKKDVHVNEVKNPFGFQKKVKTARCILDRKMNKKKEKKWIKKISLELIQIPQFSYNERLWNPPLNHTKNNEKIKR